MSLYRTWRPKSFGDLVGQDAVVRTLRTALSSGRLAHAYLFSGPRGSGKTSAAKILARCVDCVNGPTPEPDNTCENCLAILAGTALDVLEIDAASNRGINEIRELREAVKYAPSQMRMKVYILDEAHAITTDGANAFLKTLEEPPPHAIFILATTAPERLPATILSRCQRYAFRRIPAATMIDRMRTIADAEGIRIEDAALAAIAYRADGGLRDALTLLEQVAAFAAGALVDVASIDAAFGASGRRYASDLAAALLREDAGGALGVVDEASDAGADMQELLRGTVARLRDLLVARLNPDLLARDLALADAEQTRSTAGSVPQARLVRGLRLFSDALAAARYSPSPRLDVETAVMRFVAGPDDATLEGITARLTRLEERTGAGGRPTSSTAEEALASQPPPARERAPAAAATSAPPEPDPEPPRGVPAGSPVTLQQVRSLWQSIRTRIEEESKPLKAPLSRATVDAVADGSLVLGLSDASQAEFLRARAVIVERAIAEVLGVPLRLAVHVERAPQPRSGHRAAKTYDPESAAATDDPDLALLDYAAKTVSEKAGER